MRQFLFWTKTFRVSLYPSQLAYPIEKGEADPRLELGCWLWNHLWFLQGDCRSLGSETCLVCFEGLFYPRTTEGWASLSLPEQFLHIVLSNYLSMFSLWFSLIQGSLSPHFSCLIPWSVCFRVKMKQWNTFLSFHFNHWFLCNTQCFNSFDTCLHCWLPASPCWILVENGWES